ncbi:hypothetical protein CLV99_2803 [Sphingobacterium yanglingense]|uniref:Uncharacterized protein n=1 Tax=Sphingobacterium yanglingense TaxID=1437280 RepID=A0A4R6WGS6_9SPHI|nr:hypothetical protein CLV99_2803 [Sphingobacterium yanglingense]
MLERGLQIIAFAFIFAFRYIDLSFNFYFIHPYDR